MAPLYRYLEPQWADALMERGVMRVGSLASFRQQEDGLGDELDGKLRTHTAHHVLNSDDPSTYRGLRQFAISPTGGHVDAVFENCVFEQVIAGHALCLCNRPDNEHFFRQRRTAVVEITEPGKYAACLSWAAQDLGWPFGIGEVGYNAQEMHPLAYAEPINPFQKRPRFAVEEETRIYWPNARIGPPIIVTSEASRRHLRRIR